MLPYGAHQWQLCSFQFDAQSSKLKGELARVGCPLQRHATLPDFASECLYCFWEVFQCPNIFFHRKHFHPLDGNYIGTPNLSGSRVTFINKPLKQWILPMDINNYSSLTIGKGIFVYLATCLDILLLPYLLVKS